MKMRFRTDGSYFDPDAPDGRPAPQPGDVWRISWHHEVNGEQLNDWTAGYAICCPGCGEIHHWTTASNCFSRRPGSASCDHTDAHGSCWNWTGSAEHNTLSATPSLQVTAKNCKWHGFLTNGELIGV